MAHVTRVLPDLTANPTSVSNNSSLTVSLNPSQCIPIYHHHDNAHLPGDRTKETGEKLWGSPTFYLNIPCSPTQLFNPGLPHPDSAVSLMPIGLQVKIPCFINIYSSQGDSWQSNKSFPAFRISRSSSFHLKLNWGLTLG